MTYRDSLMEQSSFDLYYTLHKFVRCGGELDERDEALYERAGKSTVDDESEKDELVDLVDRLHDDDLL